MTTRIGKIARLPKPIRQQLNQRLDNGETAAALVKWLNTLPEVQKLLTEQFAGKAIRPQNLSQWRNGGYLDWSRHQLLREQTRWTTEQSIDLHSDIDANTISIAENVALIMSAELAIHVQALLGIKNPKQRFRQFCRLSRELSRIRRDDQRAVRTQMRRPENQPTLYPARPEPETQNSQPEIVEQLETQNPKPETTAQPETSEPAQPQLDTRPPTLAPSAPEPQTGEPSPAPEPPKLVAPEPPSPHSTLDTRPSTLATCEIVPNCHYPDINYQLPTTPPPVIPLNPTKSQYKKYPMMPIRGRRFTCVEG